MGMVPSRNIGGAQCERERALGPWVNLCGEQIDPEWAKGLCTTLCGGQTDPEWANRLGMCVHETDSPHIHLQRGLMEPGVVTERGWPETAS